MLLSSLIDVMQILVGGRFASLPFKGVTTLLKSVIWRG